MDIPVHNTKLVQFLHHLHTSFSHDSAYPQQAMERVPERLCIVHPEPSQKFHKLPICRPCEVFQLVKRRAQPIIAHKPIFDFLFNEARFEWNNLDESWFTRVNNSVQLVSSLSTSPYTRNVYKCTRFRVPNGATTAFGGQCNVQRIVSFLECGKRACWIRSAAFANKLFVLHN
jgi:hypothetical protein